MRPWKIVVACLFLIGLLLLTSKKDAFQNVIENQSRTEIKDKLLIFKDGGIEKPVSLKKYDPERIIKYAMTFLKTPHQMGGVNKKGIDCSGLVMVAHEPCGIELPHSSQEQGRYGKIIPDKKDLQRGDLVFFYDSYETSRLITHSGIYLGEDKFIHTSSSKGVVITGLNDPYYWGSRFLFGTRLN